MKHIKGTATILVITLFLAMFSMLGGVITVSAEPTFSGTVYYVDADNGNDSNAGTSKDRAWQTLNNVNNMTLQPGDAVLLKKGCVWNNSFLYPKGSGTETMPITISTYGEGDKPVVKSMYDDDIDGLPDVDAAIFLKNTSYVTVDGLYVINGTPGTGSQYGIRVLLNSGYTTSGIQIKNCTVYGSNVKNWATSSKSGLSGITISSDSYSGYINGLLIENNEIYNCKGTGISVNGSVGGCNKDGSTNDKSAKNVVVHGNFLDNIGSDGIVVNNCYKPLVEYNTCSTAHSYASGAHVAIWPFACYGALLQYNEAYNTQTIGDGQGFDCDYQCYNTVFQYNYSHDNQGGFMLICCEPSDWNGNSAYNVGSIVRYNISQNDYHYTFSLVGAIDNTQIYNNTLYSRWGLSSNSTNTFFQFSKGASKFNGRTYADNTLIANNIFYVDSCASFGLSETTNTVFKNNLTYGRNMYNAPKNDTEETTADGITSSGNIVGKNPHFINGGGSSKGIKTAEAYMLYDDSPAINAGTVIDNNGGLDYFGNAVSATNAPNIGAFNGSGVKYDKASETFDGKYMPLLDFEDYDVSLSNTSLPRIVQISNSKVTVEQDVTNKNTGSKKAIKITSLKDATGAYTKFMIYPDQLANSTGIRFWVSGNGTAKTGAITFTANGKTYSKNFNIAANGGYVTFSWNEKYTGSNEARVTNEIMRQTTSIEFMFKSTLDDSITIDDLQKNIGEFDPEYTEPTFYYPKRETVLVEDFEGYTDVSSHGSNKYGGPSAGPNGNNGSTVYNGSRVIFADSVSGTDTGVTSYISYSDTFLKLRNALQLDGAEGIQFDMPTVITYSDGSALSDDDEYIIRDKRNIYKYSPGSSNALNVTASNGTVVSIKWFYTDLHKTDGNSIARVPLDELKYYYAATKQYFYLKDFSKSDIANWISGLNSMSISYSTCGGFASKELKITWYMDNLSVYGTFGDIAKTTYSTTAKPTTTTAPITTTTATTTPTTTTAPTTITTTKPVENIIFGDVNDDGLVNSKDVLQFRKYNAAMGVSLNIKNADINSDGIINTKDLLALRKHLSGMPVEPWK